MNQLDLDLELKAIATKLAKVRRQLWKLEKATLQLTPSIRQQPPKGGDIDVQECKQKVIAYLERQGKPMRWYTCYRNLGCFRHTDMTFKRKVLRALVDSKEATLDPMTRQLVIKLK